MSLTQANLARQEQALDKVYRFSFGVASFREAIEQGRYTKSEQAEVQKIEYSRKKFNRMNNEEQKIYEARLKETKTEYRLYQNDDCFSVVPKMVYEYFNLRKAAL